MGTKRATSNSTGMERTARSGSKTLPLLSRNRRRRIFCAGFSKFEQFPLAPGPRLGTDEGGMQRGWATRQGGTREERGKKLWIEPPTVAKTPNPNHSQSGNKRALLSIYLSLALVYFLTITLIRFPSSFATEWWWVLFGNSTLPSVVGTLAMEERREKILSLSFASLICFTSFWIIRKNLNTVAGSFFLL